jgi:DNA-directed RNA polymerase specialized sigma24 family protein
MPLVIRECCELFRLGKLATRATSNVLSSQSPSRKSIVPNDGSVTGWIFDLQDGNDDAESKLWHRYFERMAKLARKHIQNHAGRSSDEEDVALSAFESFFRRSSEGQLSDLRGRDELWRLLALITKRKALNLIRHEQADKRGGGWSRLASQALDVAGSEPTPEHTAEILDEIQRLLEVVLAGEDQLCFILLRKLEGHDTTEIANRLNCTNRTVQRKFERICILWQTDLSGRA